MAHLLFQMQSFIYFFSLYVDSITTWSPFHPYNPLLKGIFVGTQDVLLHIFCKLLSHNLHIQAQLYREFCIGLLYTKTSMLFIILLDLVFPLTIFLWKSLQVRRLTSHPFFLLTALCFTVWIYNSRLSYFSVLSGEIASKCHPNNYILKYLQNYF